MADQSGAVADRLRAQRAALADFGLHAFRSNDLDELLHGASRLVSEALEVDLVKVLEHWPERGQMFMRAGVHWEPGVVGTVTFADDQHSPGGYALKAGEAVVSRDVATETRFEIPEVLLRHGVRSMVNVIIDGKRQPYGVLEVDARDKRDFNEDDVAFLRTYANLLSAAIERIRTHAELENRAREQSILARELGHRVKNVLGLVQAIASQTFVQGRTAEEFQKALVGRLQALAAAEDMVFDTRSDSIDVRKMALVVLEPHRLDRPRSVAIEGPSLRLPARQGRMLGLAFHELATNAAKYGALSKPQGMVRLHWALDEAGQHLTLLWQERDGPEVRPPDHDGFGTRLLQDVVRYELEGTAELEYLPDGLRYRLEFPLSEDEG
jgi:two-component sensor histidine kinase